MSVDSIIAKTFEVAGPACESAGFELVDIRFVMEQGQWVLRLFVDRLQEEVADGEDEEEFDLYAPNDSRVNLADCEELSRELSALFDVEDYIPHAFALEVSSPGIDRPLRTTKHFAKVIGHEAKVSLRQGVAPTNTAGMPISQPRKNFRGFVLSVSDADNTVTMDVDKVTYVLPLSDLDQAKFVPDWDRVLRPNDVTLQKKDKKKKSTPVVAGSAATAVHDDAQASTDSRKS